MDTPIPEQPEPAEEDTRPPVQQLIDALKGTHVMPEGITFTEADWANAFITIRDFKFGGRGRV